MTPVDRDKDVLVVDPKTSPAGVLSAGLTATRGGKVVNSLGRTSTAVGRVAIVVVCAALTVVSTCRLCPYLFP